VFSITPWPPYPRERSTVTTDYKEWSAPEPVVRVERRKEYFLLAGNGLPNPSVRSLITALIELYVKH